jgi:predicted secreted protein
MQLLPAVTGQAWYVSEQLAVAVKARHGQYYGDQTGSRCPGCAHWEMASVSAGDAPIRSTSIGAASDVIASLRRSVMA